MIGQDNIFLTNQHQEQRLYISPLPESIQNSALETPTSKRKESSMTGKEIRSGDKLIAEVDYPVSIFSNRTDFALFSTDFALFSTDFVHWGCYFP